MPQFQRGEMWDAFEKADLFLLPTSSTIGQDGALVMSSGLAKQAQERFPGLATALGRHILQTRGRLGSYHLLVSRRWPTVKLGAFQVTQQDNEPASLAMIQHSALALWFWCRQHPSATVHLPLPVRENGRLSREAVLPVLAWLPAQVVLWEPAAD